MANPPEMGIYQGYGLFMFIYYPADPAGYVQEYCNESWCGTGQADPADPAHQKNAARPILRSSFDSPSLTSMMPSSAAISSCHSSRNLDVGHGPRGNPPYPGVETPIYSRFPLKVLVLEKNIQCSLFLRYVYMLHVYVCVWT